MTCCLCLDELPWLRESCPYYSSVSQYASRFAIAHKIITHGIISGIMRCFIPLYEAPNYKDIALSNQAVDAIRIPRDLNGYIVRQQYIATYMYGNHVPEVHQSQSSEHESRAHHHFGFSAHGPVTNDSVRQLFVPDQESGGEFKY